jgi:hypothetical protein
LMNDLFERIFWYKLQVLTFYSPSFNTIHECWLNMLLMHLSFPFLGEFCVSKMLLCSFELKGLIHVLWMNSPNLYLFITSLLITSIELCQDFLLACVPLIFVVSVLLECVTTTWLVGAQCFETLWWSQGIGYQSPGDMASHHRRMDISTAQMWKLENSHDFYVFYSRELHRNLQLNAKLIVVSVCSSVGIQRNQ